MTAMIEAYSLGGLTLVSELPLPELPKAMDGAKQLDAVKVILADVTFPPPGTVQIDAECFASSTLYALRIPGLATYQVREGREILVAMEPGALPLDVRAYLLGTLFAVLCQQRGLLPLHASAVCSGRGAVAFLGRSGMGKSSLAAHLSQRGFEVVGDDICLADTSKTPPMVIPAAPWLKLWRKSLQSLGREPEGLERVFSEDDKYRFPLRELQPVEPTVQAIDRLVFLESADAGPVRLEEVTAIETIPLLMNLTHQAYILEATGQWQESFLRCSRVAAAAKSYRLYRPWGLEHLGSTLDLLEGFLRQS
jgi:hypothetical protein